MSQFDNIDMSSSFSLKKDIFEESKGNLFSKPATFFTATSAETALEKIA